MNRQTIEIILKASRFPSRSIWEAKNRIVNTLNSLVQRGSVESFNVMEEENEFGTLRVDVCPTFPLVVETIFVTVYLDEKLCAVAEVMES